MNSVLQRGGGSCTRAWLPFCPQITTPLSLLTIANLPLLQKAPALSLFHSNKTHSFSIYSP